MSPLDWTNLGVGLAAVVANVVIVSLFVKFLGNHLSKNTKALESVERTLSILAERVGKNG